LCERRSKDRTKDIIYSKLQKQRMALSIFEKIMAAIRSKRSYKKFSTEDHKKVDSVANLFKGVQEFCKHIRETNYQLIPCAFTRDHMDQCLKQFEEHTLPPFLKDSEDLFRKLYVEPLTAVKKTQLYQATTHLIGCHQAFSKDDVLSLKEKSRGANGINKRKKKELLKSIQVEKNQDDLPPDELDKENKESLKDLSQFGAYNYSQNRLGLQKLDSREILKSL
jgi:hypothetical protein